MLRGAQCHMTSSETICNEQQQTTATNEWSLGLNAVELATNMLAGVQGVALKWHQNAVSQLVNTSPYLL